MKMGLKQQNFYDTIQVEEGENMKLVKYGEWEIAVDIEKTKEYYISYVSNSNQANRNFAEYCKVMPSEEKAFFESFGIAPECCEIEHIGVNKKKEFPCGGYYLICGRYLKYPAEELISIEELAENDFEDDREDPRINIGLFEFDFQCEDYIIKDIPGDIPEGFICVRFWCENMRWLLDEKPDADMIMYEPPRFWELGKIIKEKREAKKQRVFDLQESKQEFKTVFEQLGIGYSELNGKEIKAHKKNWVAAFSPKNADKKEISRLCLSKKKYTPFLWHIFSYEFLSSEANPKECYNNTNKGDCVIISNVDEIGFAITNTEKLTANILDGFIDVTVSEKDFLWTYCKTHESMCGPYYYKNN